MPPVAKDKDAVNELSPAEAHKLPSWLRVVFNLWRIVMWTNASMIAFNDGAFKSWVENEEWNDIKETSKTKWLYQNSGSTLSKFFSNVRIYHRENIRELIFKCCSRMFSV